MCGCGFLPETGGSASACQLTEGLELPLRASQQEAPGAVSVQQGNVGSPVRGGVLPLGYPKVGRSQSPGRGFRQPLPRCEQRLKGPAGSHQRSGWQRPFGGHSQSVSSRAGLR